MKTTFKIFLLSLSGAFLVTTGVAPAQNTVTVAPGNVGIITNDPNTPSTGLTSDEKTKLQAAFNADAAANNPPGSTTEGTVSKVGSNHISLKSPDQPRTSSYSLNKATSYVNADGTPVSKSAVKMGSPVALSYVQNGDKKIVTQVLVKNTVQ